MRELAGQAEVFRSLEISLPAVALPLSEYVSVVTAHIARFSAAAVDGMYPEVHPWKHQPDAVSKLAVAEAREAVARLESSLREMSAEF